MNPFLYPIDTIRIVATHSQTHSSYENTFCQSTFSSKQLLSNIPGNLIHRPIL